MYEAATAYGQWDLPVQAMASLFESARLRGADPATKRVCQRSVCMIYTVCVWMVLTTDLVMSNGHVVRVERGGIGPGFFILKRTGLILTRTRAASPLTPWMDAWSSVAACGGCGRPALPVPHLDRADGHNRRHHRLRPHRKCVLTELSHSLSLWSGCWHMRPPSPPLHAVPVHESPSPSPQVVTWRHSDACRTALVPT